MRRQATTATATADREIEGQRAARGDAPEIRFITLHKARVEMALMMFMFHVCGLMKRNDYPRQRQRQQQHGNGNTATGQKKSPAMAKQID